MCYAEFPQSILLESACQDIDAYGDFAGYSPNVFVYNLSPKDLCKIRQAKHIVCVDVQHGAEIREDIERRKFLRVLIVGNRLLAYAQTLRYDSVGKSAFANGERNSLLNFCCKNHMVIPPIKRYAERHKAREDTLIEPVP